MTRKEELKAKYTDLDSIVAGLNILRKYYIEPEEYDDPNFTPCYVANIEKNRIYVDMTGFRQLSDKDCEKMKDTEWEYDLNKKCWFFDGIND